MYIALVSPVHKIASFAEINSIVMVKSSSNQMDRRDNGGMECDHGAKFMVVDLYSCCKEINLNFNLDLTYHKKLLQMRRLYTVLYGLQ